MSTKVTCVHAVKKVPVSKNTEEEWVCKLRSHIINIEWEHGLV